MKKWMILAAMGALTVAGVEQVRAEESAHRLGGGIGNSIQTNAYYSFLGGGQANSIQVNATHSFLGGGNQNSIQINATHSFLGGGQQNSIQTNAYYSFLGGGNQNSIQTNAQYAVIPGGFQNTVGAGAVFGFAAGRQAKANHPGTFVWADSTAANFASTANNQFLIRASGGVGINTNSPGATLDVGGSFRVNGGTVYNRMQSGIFTAGASAAQLLVVTNTFPVAFATVPAVMATAVNADATDWGDVYSVTIRRVTTTNFVANIWRLDGTSWGQLLRVSWHAWQ
jgi:hypothetical protein